MPGQEPWPPAELCLVALWGCSQPGGCLLRYNPQPCLGRADQGREVAQEAARVQTYWPDTWGLAGGGAWKGGHVWSNPEPREALGEPAQGLDHTQPIRPLGGQAANRTPPFWPWGTLGQGTPALPTGRRTHRKQTSPGGGGRGHAAPRSGRTERYYRGPSHQARLGQHSPPPGGPAQHQLEATEGREVRITGERWSPEPAHAKGGLSASCR